MRRSALSRNHYFVFGLFVGLVLSFYIPQDIWELVQQEECPQETAESSLIEKFGQEFEPHLNLINKPLAAKKPVKNVIRPRYYSSELGIREKLFVGVMTSQDNINTLATAINRTTAHLVSKMKFFINADNVKTNYKLKNIVGFTDTRDTLRPFHVIKYIADNYLDDYDYFLIMPDTVYVDARKLKSMLFHISITFDLYMGRRTDAPTVGGAGGVAADVHANVNSNANGNANGNGNSNSNSYNADNDDFKMLSDRNYCDLSAGIVLSSSVIRKMRNNLDWCVRNGATNVHSVNIGRCVKYSSNLAGCQESFQGIQQQSFSLRPYVYVKLFKDLNLLAKDEMFRNASTIYPVSTADDFYRLHAYFSRYHLELVQQNGYALEHKSYRIANGTISNNILEIRWPLGVPLATTPETRHDIIAWRLLNRTHIFLPRDDQVVEPLNHIESLDFEKVLSLAIQYAGQKYPTLQFVAIHTAYRRFDATRGMDYHLHLTFKDTKWPQLMAVKSFQVVKPLGRVEVVPSPYVTESTRIAIIVPTFEHQVQDALDFITQYERVCMRNQDNTFLLMVFLYRFDSPSKGEMDPFKPVKTIALDLSTKYKIDGSRIAWVSIRLPVMLSQPMPTEDIMLNTLYGRSELLSVAVADLALPKLGLDSMVLMASSAISFKSDFLNRVRMNTIQGFQVYAPIGFMMYPCQYVNFCKDCDTCDVSQGSGYFDKWNFDVVSFYSRDYVQARRSVEEILPIVRSDNDIDLLLTRADKATNIVEMFVSSRLPLHILRGVEPNLRFGRTIASYIAANGGAGNEPIDLPLCPPKAGANVDLDMSANVNSDGNSHDHDNAINNYINNFSHEMPRKHEHATQSMSHCIHLASRKQIGDAIIRYEDRSILHK